MSINTIYYGGMGVSMFYFIMGVLALGNYALIMGDTPKIIANTLAMISMFYLSFEYMDIMFEWHEEILNEDLPQHLP